MLIDVGLAIALAAAVWSIRNLAAPPHVVSTLGVQLVCHPPATYGQGTAAGASALRQTQQRMHMPYWQTLQQPMNTPSRQTLQPPAHTPSQCPRSSLCLSCSLAWATSSRAFPMPQQHGRAMHHSRCRSGTWSTCLRSDTWSACE